MKPSPAVKACGCLVRKHYELYPPKVMAWSDGSILDKPTITTVTMETEKLKRFRNDYLILLQFAQDVIGKDEITSLDLLNWYSRPPGRRSRK